MTWIHAALVLIPTALLCVQGISCLRHPREEPHVWVRQFGWLSIFLSGLCLLVSLLLWSGALVQSPELHLSMVQGQFAWYGMALLLVGLAVSSVAAWQVSRVEAGRPSLPYVALGIGVIIGCLAAYRLQPLNAIDLEQFHVYAYDLWWPPLLAWLTVCLVETMLTILRCEDLRARLWLTAASITGLAALALAQPRLGDPSSKALWQVYWLVLLPCSMSLVTWLLLQRRSQRQTWLQGFVRGAIAAPPAAIGLLNAFHWYGDSLPEIPSGLWRSIVRWYGEAPFGMMRWAALLCLGLPVFVGLIKFVRQYFFSSPRQAHQMTPQMWRHPTPRQGILLAIALGLIIVELMHLQDIDRAVAVAIFIVAWILLAEALLPGPLADFLPRWRQVSTANVSTWTLQPM